MRTILALALAAGSLAPAVSAQVVATAAGRVEGTTANDGVRVFKGIPFAAPPVRELRWKPPRPPAEWVGVRPADRFGPRCMQKPIFSDMVFRSEGVSEDCLYLNVWTPAVSSEEKLPVLVYFYGGGFIAGDGSEPRYDGAAMARRGLVAVTANYRLGVFGFLAHPELSRESPHRASGNYGLLDQVQALGWVRDNVAAFGGDPARVTIAGESAGSISVSALMASPLARGLFAGAIGESGSILGTLSAVPLAEAERAGERLAEEIGAPSLAALRALSSSRLLDLASKPGPPRLTPAVDGWFLPRPPEEIFVRGEQARVPLLVGWNSEEMTYRVLFGPRQPTAESFAQVVRELYGDAAGEALTVYRAATPAEVIEVATDLAGDRFIGYSTWKWFDLHRRTGGAPVFRYYYTHPRPPARPGDPAAGAPPPAGAVHSAEIEYALGNLASNAGYAWTEDDHRVSELMQGYFANFVRAADPNGPGLPAWPAAAGAEDAPSMVLRIAAESRAEPERHRERYLFLDRSRDAGAAAPVP